MILNSTPQNEAILSNVGQIGEFRIRNSAKAFSILSSGLYANKIRAIVRELSCNAVDSHVASGNTKTPFDVHLPNDIEPWFSIRDYGTGLSHEQVTNIYTTYFESTKTDSNAFIGALGLGSKSPFSYTDNFTVTAIMDGKRGIYSAFINEHGVPSIALMQSDESTDPAGVEVKFSVNDRYDYRKFAEEARNVYTHFALRPVVCGQHSFKFENVEYSDKDVIPGVHVNADKYAKSIAIMGNIAYPIEVPNSDTTMGDLRKLLACNLVIHFDIGELDFQASREGLSYIPSTIESIKRKLEALNAQLSIHLAAEADKFKNLWERAVFVSDRMGHNLWTEAAKKYAVDSKCPTLTGTSATYRSSLLTTFKLDTEMLKSKFNIEIRGFSRSSGYAGSHKLNCTAESVYDATGAFTGKVASNWSITVSDRVSFVFNDTKTGALERAKYHWKTSSDHSKVNGSVYVVEPADKKKPVKKEAFLRLILTPPNKQVLKASDLLMKDRSVSMGKNVSIMYLHDKSYSRWNTKIVWSNAGTADKFDPSKTYYYLPVSGYTSLGKMSNVKSMHNCLQSSGIFSEIIYGVRKTDIDWVKLQKNWVNLDEHVTALLTKLGSENIFSLVKQNVDFGPLLDYNKVLTLIDATSPLAKLLNTFKDVAVHDPIKRGSISQLCSAYNVVTDKHTNLNDLVVQYKAEVTSVNQRYPLLRGLHVNGYSSSSVNMSDVADYVKMVDSIKGV